MSKQYFDEIVYYFNDERPMRRIMRVHHKKDSNRYDRVYLPEHPKHTARRG